MELELRLGDSSRLCRDPLSFSWRSVTGFKLLTLVKSVPGMAVSILVNIVVRGRLGNDMRCEGQTRILSVAAWSRTTERALPLSHGHTPCLTQTTPAAAEQRN